MKKTLLSIVLVLGVAGTYAQDLTSKKGEPMLPESGDWAISIEATPLLNYFGNMFSQNGNTAPTWNHLNVNNTIIGKMFKDEKTAYRGILRIGMTSNTERQMVAQATTSTFTFPTLPTMVEDSWKHSSRYIGLGAGIEMRRGKTRLQGYYGADAMVGMSGSSDKFEYGNTANPSGTPVVNPGDGTFSSDFGLIITDPNGGTNQSNLNYGNVTYTNDNRLLSLKSGGFFFGVRGFIGAEYFVFPKISFGGDFGWGLTINSSGKSKAEYQAVEVVGGTPTLSTINEETGKSGGWSIDTNRDLFGTGMGSVGSLRATLHF